VVVVAGAVVWADDSVALAEGAGAEGVSGWLALTA
jgi:hypothetical protein